ncbi:MAG: twin-arginine translocation signal domain-containing protein [Sulfitobacter sp.]
MTKLNRRTFLKNSAAVSLGGSCLSSSFIFAPRPAHAVVTMAAVSTSFNLAAGVLGFFNRRSNPTIPLLISISDAVEALGIKIDAIDEKLDVLVAEIAALRADVSQLPFKTNLQEVLGEMREPWDAFVERSRGVDLERPSNTYLNDLRPTLDRLQVARRKFLRLSGSGDQRTYDGVTDLALAQDAEIAIGGETMRPEMFERGLEVDATAFRSALQEYRAYFLGALDESNPNSIPAMKAHYRLSAERILGRRESSISAFERALREDIAEMRTVQCQPYVFQCLQYFNRGLPSQSCAEPGERKGAKVTQSVALSYRKAAAVPPSLGRAPDELELPHFFAFSTLENCVNDGSYERINVASPEVASAATKQIADLNAVVLSYYQLQYVQEIAVEALNINQRIEAQLASQMDL